VENAQKAIAQAEAKTAEYAEKLRQARAEIFKMREQKAKQRSAEREAALDAARKTAGARVSEGRAEMDAETERAKQAILGSAGELANQVVRAVLPLAAGSSR
jgi:F-type H+-transporting ATPase subunit b